MFIITEEQVPYIKKQRTFLKKASHYYDSCKKDFEYIKNSINVSNIKPLVGPIVFWDIGCGMAGTDALLNKYYDSFFFLWDEEDNNNTDYGFETTDRFYSKKRLTQNFLRNNGLDFDRYLWMCPVKNHEIDIVFSLFSWCWHYPVETYYENVLDVTVPGSLVIVDIRIDTNAEKIFEKDFTEIYNQTVLEETYKGKRYTYLRR